jgi:hypothetical protein
MVHLALGKELRERMVRRKNEGNMRFCRCARVWASRVRISATKLRSKAVNAPTFYGIKVSR